MILGLFYLCGVVLVTQPFLTLRDPHGLETTRLLCPWNSPGQHTGVSFHSLLQGIFLTQGSNLGLSCIAGELFTV